MHESQKNIIGISSLRFFAFSTVFLFHVWKPFTIGYLGVDVFFIISSFLLSYLALHEYKNTGTFSASHFFIRRVLRIFPLYYLVIFFLLLIVPWLAAKVGHSIQQAAHPEYYPIFLSNLDSSDHLFALKMLWSISVEEQFYFCFMILCMIAMPRIHWMAALFSIVYIVYMIYAIQYNANTYTSLFPHLIQFAAGCISAYIFFYQKSKSVYCIAAIVLGMVLSIIFFKHTLLFPICFSIGLAGFITWIATQQEKIKNYKPLFLLTEKAGMYSYGLYVYSGIVISAFNIWNPSCSIFCKILTTFASTCILAVVSYHLYEVRFLSLKKRFSST